MDAKKKKMLEKKGIKSAVDLLYHIPNKYYDFTTPKPLDVKYNGQNIAVVGKLTKVEKKNKNGRTQISCILETDTGNLFVMFIGQAFMYDKASYYMDQQVVCCGKLQYNIDFGNFSMINPIKFDLASRKEAFCWHLVYPKYAGISADWLLSETQLAFGETIPETIPDEIRTRFHLLKRKEYLRDLHQPKNENSIKSGVKTAIFEDLLYFACKLEIENRRKVADVPELQVKSTAIVGKVIDSLPYALTDDQSKCVSELLEVAKSGKRVDALVQGDVGCGKTIVAFLLAIAMAENGYQSLIMAPTLVLASQHYEELKAMVEPYGITVAFMNGTMTVKEKKVLLSQIFLGQVQIVVGTNAVLSEKVQFEKLGLAVVDEEHRFGVGQKESFDNVHTVMFSATPIPRSVISSICGTTVIQEIKQMPAGRKPIQTCITHSDLATTKFIKKELDKGRQAYVICPLVEKNEKSKLLSVEEVRKKYEQYFPGRTGVITGKMKKQDVADTLAKFQNNELQILVASTVVEVGVNIPNATVMVIENATQFGLAQLHQLRGRVGRGNYEGYCVLKAEEASERLEVLTSTTDGFKIAEEDLRLRGAGNILGEEQSGSNRFIEEAIEYKNMFAIAKECAKSMVDNEDLTIIEEMEKRSDKIYVSAPKVFN